MLHKAQLLSKKGKISILDSFYDKLFHLYIESDGIQWLFDKSDAYYDEMKSIAEKDYKFLPNAHCLIFFKISYRTWKKFLQSRGRELDQDKQFLQNCYKSQEDFLRAARRYCSETNCELVICNEEFSSPDSVALKLFKTLKEKAIF
jgi:hypothetical protein